MVKGISTSVPPLHLTGERTLPDVPEENYWYQRHLVAYRWIASRVGGRRVVDLACGGGLMAPHAARLGYRHVGVDVGVRGLRVAREHGVLPVRGSVLAVPLADGCADVVVAGEILEHVEDDVGVLAECARLLRPGGTLVLDSLAATRIGRFLTVTVAERLPGGPPPGIHDPALFVDRARLLAAADALGLELRLVGLRPSFRDALAWRLGRRATVRMKPVRSTAAVFAGYGRRR